MGAGQAGSSRARAAGPGRCEQPGGAVVHGQNRQFPETQGAVIERPGRRLQPVAKVVGEPSMLAGRPLRFDPRRLAASVGTVGDVGLGDVGGRAFGRRACRSDARAAPGAEHDAPHGRVEELGQTWAYRRGGRGPAH